MTSLGMVGLGFWFGDKIELEVTMTGTDVSCHIV